MRRIDLTIEALSPLAIGQRKPGGSVSEALDYIPGTVIRGAIAKAMLKLSGKEPEEGDDFFKLFLSDTAAIFCNAYPAIAKHGSDDYRLSTQPVKVVPASALSNKTNPGFKSEFNDKTVGVFDSLIDGFCAEQQGLFYTPNDIKGELVDTFSGFYSCDGMKYHSHSISKRLLTRVGINRKRATAQDEILYSIEVTNESQGRTNPIQTVYRSSILVQETTEFADALIVFLRSHCTHLRLGGSASRGLGKVRLTVSDANDATQSTLTERVTAFNKKLEDRWKLWQVLGDVARPASRTFFSLTLHSDAILSEQWRRTIAISPAMLAPALKIPAADIQSHRIYSTHSYRAGWNAAWGLPKDTELVTNMGGVMLFSISKKNEQLCCTELAGLEKVGIGSRRSEGYGQVRVCDEFHLIMREKLV